MEEIIEKRVKERLKSLKEEYKIKHERKLKESTKLVKD